MTEPVFGLKDLSRKIPELLQKKVKNKNNPEKWKWKPDQPAKIKNLTKEIRAERKQVNYAALSNYTATNKRQKVVLLFSMGNLNYGLIKKFEEQRIKYVFIDYVQFISKGNISIVLTSKEQKKHLKIGDIEINLEDISVVLWNPPKFPAPVFDFNMIPPRKGRNEFLYRKRWGQFLKDFKLLLNKNVQWIPGDPFTGTQDWQNKIGEYKLMLDLGLNVPPTLFTNDKNSLLEFSKQYNHKLLLREFSTPPFSFPPIPIDIRKKSLNNLTKSPCCFQAYVEKKYEIRAVVLFDKIFPCKIYSQDSELTKNDWRVHDDANVKWELTELPVKISEQIQKLRKSLGLNWCSVDLIYSTDNNYYILEANRPGAHYWLDLFVGLDITKEIINVLVNNKLIEKL